MRDAKALAESGRVLIYNGGELPGCCGVLL